MPSIEINGEAHALKMTWASHKRLKDALGEDFTDAIQLSFDKRDVDTLAIAVSAFSDTLTPDYVMEHSPPITLVYEALIEAMKLSFYGESMKPSEGEKSPKKRASLSALKNTFLGRA